MIKISYKCMNVCNQYTKKWIESPLYHIPPYASAWVCVVNPILSKTLLNLKRYKVSMKINSPFYEYFARKLYGFSFITANTLKGSVRRKYTPSRMCNLLHCNHKHCLFRITFVWTQIFRGNNLKLFTPLDVFKDANKRIRQRIFSI